MIFIKKPLILLVCLIVLLAACQNKPQAINTQSSPSVASQEAGLPSLEENKLMECLYFDKEGFSKSIAAPAKYLLAGDLKVGMIPHHLLAGDMIAGFFSLAAESAKTQQYDGVFLIAPSHFPQNCKSDVVTSTLGWATPFGAVKPDSEMIAAILDNDFIAAQNSSAATEADHGVAGLIPYISYYLPQTPVATCLVANTLSPERLDQVIAEILKVADKRRILVIASVDCSHYLMPQISDEYDRQTINAIEGFDFKAIENFDDRNIDSPQSVKTFLSVALNQSLTLKMLDHSSSALKLPHAISNPIYSEGITTYLVYGGAAG